MFAKLVLILVACRVSSGESSTTNFVISAQNPYTQDSQAKQIQIRDYIASLKQSVTTVPLVTTEASQDFLIDVPIPDRVLKIHFHTQTTQLQTAQKYLTNPSAVEFTHADNSVRTVEPPNRLQHRIHKPIVHEVHEIIQPYSKRLRHFEPVEESVQTRLYHSKPARDQEDVMGGIKESTHELDRDIEMDKIIANVLANYKHQRTFPQNSPSILIDHARLSSKM